MGVSVSGASMTFFENGVYSIRGIFSQTAYNDKLTDSVANVVFTDVAKFLPWIQDVAHLTPNKTGTSHLSRLQYLKNGALFNILPT